MHCRGIGPRTAEALRREGFLSWNDCLEREGDIPFNGKRRTRFMDEMRRSVRAMEDRDIGYFTSTFPASEQWRILESYYREVTFIDMETTGLSWHYGHATVIAAYHKGELFSFVYGENLDDFLSLADEADLLVTFNGTCFDIPFIEKTFNIPELGRPHVDLRWVAWHAGYRGGLKSIERQMGIQRPIHLEGIDGFEAVDLFYRWQAGERSARELLVEYCRADALSTYLLAERLVRESGGNISVTEAGDLFGSRVSVWDGKDGVNQIAFAGKTIVA
ncbi:MAG: ribonuclease H-like domain-containing protein [Spirochaetes bacterium]|nr:ribonuclease H-like domain-containing protein [Spirochaetota bacterium]